MHTSTRTDPSVNARLLSRGELSAVVWPARGMLVVSLRHRGVELLRRVADLEAAAAGGKTAGVALLHPWANRLSGLSYAAAGREVQLDPASALLHLDDNGLPIHGVPWSHLVWEVLEASPGRLAARLDWTSPELMAVFPFPHRLQLVLALGDGDLAFETTLTAGPEGPVPVTFGFHPYVGLAGLDRADWRLELPAMRRMVADSRGIPTGEERDFAGFSAQLGRAQFDDGFALSGDGASLGIAGAGRRITIELVRGFSNVQVFAPYGKDLVALEPMTAPTDALRSGRHLGRVEPGESFRAVFRIRVAASETPDSTTDRR